MMFDASYYVISQSHHTTWYPQHRRASKRAYARRVQHMTPISQHMYILREHMMCDGVLGAVPSVHPIMGESTKEKSVLLCYAMYAMLCLCMYLYVMLCLCMGVSCHVMSCYLVHVHV